MNRLQLPHQSICLILSTLFVVLWLMPAEPAMASDMPHQGGVTGGQYFRAECPIGSFLVGFTGRVGSWIDQLAPMCAPLSSDRLSLGPATPGPVQGTSQGGEPKTQACYPNHLVLQYVKFWMNVDGNGRPKDLMLLNTLCHKLSREPVVYMAFGSFNYPGFWSLERGAGLGPDYPGYVSTCPKNEAATGFHGRKADFIKSFGLICGPLVPRKAGTALPGDASSTQSAFSTAPTVLSPTQNGIIVKGKGEFKIVPSKYLTGTKATYQLRWVNPPAHLKGKSVDFYTQSIDVSMLTSGLPVPQTLLAPGVWEFRVQIAVPKAGDWSPWVRFNYYLQHPALGTAAEDAQAQDFQLGVGGQQKTMSGDSGTRFFRPQTTPQQGLGAGPTLIRPRGVDEKDGEHDNQTVDAPPAPETKP